MRFLLEEIIEHEVYHRLVDAGHDVVHVEVGGAPEKGSTDAELAVFSRAERRVIATYDDDFRSLPVDSSSTAELGGFMTLGRSWLE
ncbi:DUF5615 family PIN-like protein [Natronomonas sp. EA1]|uniref:DUF5615 family PIN-like protein n=1 Tax=Natronomonas sp. EA1 TaxID=3421655 RepID=UPI003EC031E7